MLLNEEEILLSLLEVDAEIKKFRTKVNQYRQQMLEAETELIGAKLKKDLLEQTLKSLRTEAED